ITRTLKNALTSGRVAHAYLFAGPRGIGKTTTARLLARALLCAERKGPEPCGACVVCTDAQPVDLIEIDAASNRRIDDVRALPAVVRASEGSLRDALSLLDTAIAYGNGTLEAATTAKLLGASAPREVRAFAAALLRHETVAAVEAIDRAVREGDDVQAFTRD